MSTLEAFLPLFEPETLGKLVSRKALATGGELFEAGRTVTDIVFDSGCLRGKVKGSQPLPHHTTLKLQPDLSLGHVEKNTVYADPADRARFLEGLRKAGLKG